MIDEPRRKRKAEPQDPPPNPDDAPRTENPTKQPVALKPTPVVYFTRESWMMGVRVVYKCGACDQFRDQTDLMVEHVLLHYPADQQEEMFDKLLAYAKEME
jgi:hypothetical protein